MTAYTNVAANTHSEEINAHNVAAEPNNVTGIARLRHDKKCRGKTHNRQEKGSDHNVRKRSLVLPESNSFVNIATPYFLYVAI